MIANTLSLIALAALVLSYKCQSCTERFMELSLLKYRAGQISSGVSSSVGVLDPQVRLLTDIEFTCSTVITNVLLGINVLTVTDTRNTYPSILLVRRLGTHYTVLAEQTIYYTTENVSTNGVYNYSLSPPISIDDGTVLGIRVNSNDTVTIHYQALTGGDTFNTTKLTSLNDTDGISILNELVLVHPIVESPDCVSSSVNATTVTESSLNINNITIRGNQYLYPELQFTCNGTITKWIFGADGNIQDSRLQQLTEPELQIWRQTGPNTYTKIGFSSVTANATASPNVHEYYPETTLQFQQGDILGVHYAATDTRNLFSVYLQSENGPLNLINNETGSTTTLSQLSPDGNDFPLVSPVVGPEATSTVVPSTPVPSDNTTAITTSIIIVAVLIIVLAVIAVSILAVIVAKRRKSMGSNKNATKDSSNTSQLATRYNLLNGSVLTDQKVPSDTDTDTKQQFTLNTNPAYNIHKRTSLAINDSAPEPNEQEDYDYIEASFNNRHVKHNHSDVKDNTSIKSTEELDVYENVEITQDNDTNHYYI